MRSNAALWIDLNAVYENARQIQREIGPGTRLIPVLKGDAYGLGAARVADVLSTLDGIDTFAVAHVAEGVSLREAGFAQKILLLSMPPETHLRAAVQADLVLPLVRLDQFPVLSALSREAGKPIPVSLVLDTGLHRLGFDFSEADELCAALRDAGNALSLQGTYSHFAGSGPEFSRAQEALFHRFLEKIRAAGMNPGPLHMSSSASLEEGLALDLDAVRVGRRLFLDAPGPASAIRDRNLPASPEEDPDAIRAGVPDVPGPAPAIREAFSLRAFLTDIRFRKAGETVGYGGKIVLDRDTRIGIISIGYGDGLDPALAEAKAPVLVRGARASLLSCCMDQSLIDLGSIPAAPGDSVTLFGPDETGAFLSAQEVAGLIGCEGVDLTARLTPRVERIYLSILPEHSGKQKKP